MPRLIPGSAGTFAAMETITTIGGINSMGLMLKLFFRPLVIMFILDKSAEAFLYFVDKNPKIIRVIA